MARENAASPGGVPVEVVDERWSVLQWVIDRRRHRSSLLAAAAARQIHPAREADGGGPLARVRGWLVEQFPGPSTLTRADRGVWAAAGSLEHLCGLTGLWLTGEIASQPGYYGREDVDEPDAPGITAALLALNRAGFLTRSSQAGFHGGSIAAQFGPDFEAADWVQVAAVTGYTTPAVADRLQQVLAGTGYRIQSHPAQATEQDHHQVDVDDTGQGEGVPVTFLDGQPYTVFGSALTGEDIDFELAGCSPAARAAVKASRQVVIWDPVPGRNTLWEHLQQTLDGDPA